MVHSTIPLLSFATIFFRRMALRTTARSIRRFFSATPRANAPDKLPFEKPVRLPVQRIHLFSPYNLHRPHIARSDIAPDTNSRFLRVKSCERHRRKMLRTKGKQKTVQILPSYVPHAFILSLLTCLLLNLTMHL